MTLNRRNWSREETLLALNLYCRIPFGRQHKGSAEVVELASVIGRTPSSVAMKLNNFTSLDPEERIRGVKGLSGASNLDREIWNEMHGDWEKIATESEQLWLHKMTENSPDTITDEDYSVQWSGVATETQQLTTVRLAQGFFRRTVLASYLNRCCVTGIPIPELLIASHILPWSKYPEHRVNPCNGLCLSSLYDKAFDKGLLTFDEDLKLVLSRKLRDCMTNEVVEDHFLKYEGRQLKLPEKFSPDKQLLAEHRATIFDTY